MPYCHNKKSKPPIDNTLSKQHRNERTSIRSEKRHKGTVDDARINLNTFHEVEDRANDKRLLLVALLQLTMMGD